MKKEILFASHNSHKVEEIRKMLPASFSLLGLKDINWTIDIPEPFDTYEANARAKAEFLYERTALSCFADDSGLEVDALDGRPGVFSARYAGVNRDNNDNIKKVLQELGDAPRRTARFHSVIAYLSKQNLVTVFRGVVEGKIGYTPIGDGGFGYDPIFIPDGFNQTFGELPDNLKNMISHRSKAFQQFVEFLS